jgi:predicted ATP-dependent protease
VQPIGGVNEKLEGFFSACRIKGLTGRQGVIIPVQNVRNLMLREDVLEAVKTRQFVIYAVSRFDEAVELLLGTPVGTRDAEGNYPAETVFGKVAARMELWRLAEKQDEKDDEEEEPTEKQKHEPAEPGKAVRRR